MKPETGTENIELRPTLRNINKKEKVWSLAQNKGLMTRSEHSVPGLDTAKIEANGDKLTTRDNKHISRKYPSTFTLHVKSVRD